MGLLAAYVTTARHWFTDTIRERCLLWLDHLYKSLEEASPTASLSERDKDIIKAYLARRTLIEAFSEETVDEE